MKVATVVALVAAGTAPFVASTGVEWLGIDDVTRVMNGENLTKVAADIAQREFHTGATLEILDVETRTTTIGSWGVKIRADEDHVYHHVRVVLTNTGRLDMPVHTRHFRAVDDINHTYAAEWGLAHLVDTPRLPPGASEIGVVVFHMPDYVPLERILWEGEFASAEVLLPPSAPSPEASAPPAKGEGAQPDEPAGDDAPPAARDEDEAEDDEEYQSHWDG